MDGFIMETIDAFDKRLENFWMSVDVFVKNGVCGVVQSLAKNLDTDMHRMQCALRVYTSGSSKCLEFPPDEFLLEEILFKRMFEYNTALLVAEMVSIVVEKSHGGLAWTYQEIPTPAGKSRSVLIIDGDHDKYIPGDVSWWPRNLMKVLERDDCFERRRVNSEGWSRERGFFYCCDKPWYMQN